MTTWRRWPEREFRIMEKTVITILKKYFCDVCGVEIAEGGNAPSSWAADLCGLKDLCPRCKGFARGMDTSALVLKELRRMAAEQEAPPPPAPPDTAPPAPRGKAAREKREILAAVEAYRRDHGPGSIPTLARLAKVAESELRDMISCAPVPIATWRKVGRALGVSSAGGNGGNHETD